MRLTAHTDGASKGNPGPAAIGYTIEKDGVVLEEYCEYIGDTTNNVAEYTAFIRALTHLRELGATGVVIYSDSELAVRQLNGQYKVKNTGLMPLFNRVRELGAGFAEFRVVHVPRGENSTADGLANKAIREHRKSGKLSTPPKTGA